MAATVALVGFERTRSRAGKWVAKPLASAGFVAAALSLGALDRGAYGRAIVAALVLGMVGDVLLIPGGKRTFLLGLGAFLLGHLGFAAAFLLRGVSPAVSAGALVLLALVAVPVVRWLWPHVDGKMRPPVIAYVAVITAMVALSAGAVARGASPWLAVGAIVFYLSDLTVARDRFVAPGWDNRLVGLPLYYGAQLVLAWSVVLR